VGKDYMKSNLYKEALENVECAFAYHKAVFNDKGDMVDYIFLDVNKSFENLTGLNKEEIINKRFVEDIAEKKEFARKWIEKYKDVVIEEKIVEFEEFSEEFSKHYFIKAYSPEKGYFVTVFSNKTFEKKLQEISKYFIENMGNHVDYNKIAEFAHIVSGADYTALNLFEKNGKEFTTVALTGLTENIKKAIDILGINVIDKKWSYDSYREEKTKGRELTTFNNLNNLTGNVIEKKAVKRLEKIFDTGEVVVAKIRKEDKTLGDFTLIFKKGKTLRNKDLLKIFMSQLGLFIEKTRMEKSLKLSQRRFYMLAEHAPVGFISCNIKGEVMYANKKILDILGSESYEETKNINLLNFQPLIERGFSDKLKESIEKDREISFEMGYRSIWGKNSWLRIHLKPNKDYGKIIGVNIVVDDITEKKEKEEVLKTKANRDPLTRAFNRNALDDILLDKLNESDDSNLKSCIAVVDIDDFKKINDTYGHRVGDQVLKYFAMRIKKELREEDLLIRTGGDEFLIYLHDIKNEKNASYFIKRLFEKCSSEYCIEDEIKDKNIKLDVTCSMGVSFYPRDGQTVEELMVKSDEILYKVKDKGKADYFIKM
jgi:diguanylate cyclase (GGDEF)-like protein/PAS domain S-box-containing protein